MRNGRPEGSVHVHVHTRGVVEEDVGDHGDAKERKGHDEGSTKNSLGVEERGGGSNEEETASRGHFNQPASEPGANVSALILLNLNFLTAAVAHCRILGDDHHSYNENELPCA